MDLKIKPRVVMIGIITRRVSENSLVDGSVISEKKRLMSYEKVWFHSMQFIHCSELS